MVTFAQASWSSSTTPTGNWKARLLTPCSLMTTSFLFQPSTEAELPQYRPTVFLTTPCYGSKRRNRELFHAIAIPFPSRFSHPVRSCYASKNDVDVAWQGNPLKSDPIPGLARACHCAEYSYWGSTLPSVSERPLVSHLIIHLIIKARKRQVNMHVMHGTTLEGSPQGSSTKSPFSPAPCSRCTYRLHTQT